MIDAAQGNTEMSIIGLAVSLSDNKVGHLTPNIADVDDVHVVGSKERGGDISSEIPVVQYVGPAPKRSVLENDAP